MCFENLYVMIDNIKYSIIDKFSIKIFSLIINGIKIMFLFQNFKNYKKTCKNPNVTR
jgi:hypothetical protein